MTILAATLAGDSNNQDRYVIGRDFAAVLDGATSVASDRSHDPGWFAEQIAHALAETLTAGAPTADAVAQAIETTRDVHGLTTETAPTSTVTVARWTPHIVETYVLGDSPAVVLHRDGTETIHEDHRLANVATAERTAYRSRLAAGHGYDDTHHATLIGLQAVQARRRNEPGGYWIAGTVPDAAHHGLISTTSRTDIEAIILASDGVALDRHPTATRWRSLYDDAIEHSPEQVLRRIHYAENSDPNGRRWPRAKPHDDKTIVIASLARS
ncbi:protein phosphatase 2C domain-containing protein [Myceligenerans halotolerans]